MRIWSLHPKYLDAKGLVALWRETLLAKHVLEGKTKGYKNHPQLTRFKELENPAEGISQYLSVVFEEALSRGYNFNKSKINWDFESVSMEVNSKQMTYEKEHLLRKLEVRDTDLFQQFSRIDKFEPHPMFSIIPGEIEAWEVV